MAVWFPLLLGALFAAVGLIVTERNARYLLAGYNTLPEEERAAFDLKSFLIRFRRFHLALGLSVAVIGSLLNLIGSGFFAGLFLAIYPLVAYLMFFLRLRLSGRRAFAGILVLVMALILVLALFQSGSRPARLEIEGSTVKITGMNGLELPVDRLVSVQVVNEVPALDRKVNAFAAGEKLKGLFKTSGGTEVYVYRHQKDLPFLLLEFREEPLIYFQPDSTEFSVLLESLSSLAEH